jgi:hypothetical protein
MKRLETEGWTRKGISIELDETWIVGYDSPLCWRAACFETVRKPSERSGQRMSQSWFGGSPY